MSSRSLSYLTKPPENWGKQVEDTFQSRMLLIDEVGPTCFIICERLVIDGIDENSTTDQRQKTFKFRVMIGNPHQCSCKRKHCLHITFVLLKVLRIAPSNPLAWQQALVDMEIDNVLNTFIRNRNRHIPQDKIEKLETKNTLNGKCIPRKNLRGDENCPICHDAMLESDTLVYCKQSCGNNVHAKCMRVWAEHRKSNNNPITCPLCRNDWGPLALLDIDEALKTSQKKIIHLNVRCIACKTNPIKGWRFHCLFCANIDLCERCFMRGSIHAHHPFIKRETASNFSSNWVPAFRPNAVSDSTTSATRTAVTATTTINGFPLVPMETDQSLIELQRREISTEDYSLLLTLDSSNDKINLPNYLVTCLPIIRISSSSATNNTRSSKRSSNITKVTNGEISELSEQNCKLCNAKLGTKKAIRKLSRCGHLFHERCLYEAFVSKKYNCPIDNKCIFGGLSKRSRKQQNKENDKKQSSCKYSAASSNKTTLSVADSLQSFAINGKGVANNTGLGLGVRRMKPAESGINLTQDYQSRYRTERSENNHNNNDSYSINNILVVGVNSTVIPIVPIGDTVSSVPGGDNIQRGSRQNIVSMSSDRYTSISENSTRNATEINSAVAFFPSAEMIEAASRHFLFNENIPRPETDTNTTCKNGVFSTITSDTSSRRGKINHLSRSAIVSTSRSRDILPPPPSIGYNIKSNPTLTATNLEIKNDNEKEEVKKDILLEDANTIGSTNTCYRTSTTSNSSSCTGSTATKSKFRKEIMNTTKRNRRSDTYIDVALKDDSSGQFIQVLPYSNRNSALHNIISTNDGALDRNSDTDNVNNRNSNFFSLQFKRNKITDNNISERTKTTKNRRSIVAEADNERRVAIEREIVAREIATNKRLEMIRMKRRHVFNCYSNKEHINSFSTNSSDFLTSVDTKQTVLSKKGYDGTTLRSYDDGNNSSNGDQLSSSINISGIIR